MKVRWKIHMMGLVGRQFVRGRGDVTEVSDEEGARYCELGYTEPVADTDADVETAVPADDAETRADPATVRAWAKEQGIDVPSRGKIPGDVLEQYKASAE